MSRICEYCGKKTVAGRQIARRGKAKKDGGVGIKTTGVTNRVFRPNLQKVRAVVNGTVRRVRICTRCIKSGRLTKPVKQARPAAPSPA
jgi:large subunit ribosomal protein L28